MIQNMNKVHKMTLTAILVAIIVLLAFTPSDQRDGSGQEAGRGRNIFLYIGLQDRRFRFAVLCSRKLRFPFSKQQAFPLLFVFHYSRKPERGIKMSFMTGKMLFLTFLRKPRPKAVR